MTQNLHAVNADFVFCIDATGSMKPCIEAVKKAAKTLHTDIIKAVSEGVRTVQQLRIKVIIFRDFSHDGDDAIKESRFFNLPDETADYEDFINGIEAKEGGEIPESSLEALHLAINSDWVTPADGCRTRHVIVMFTDAPAHMLDDQEYREIAEKNSLYPTDCPSDLAGLIEEWNDKMNARAKRLILLAPNVEPWPDLKENLDDCMIKYVKAADGLDEITNDAIINCLDISICGY